MMNQYCVVGSEILSFGVQPRRWHSYEVPNCGVSSNCLIIMKRRALRHDCRRIAEHIVALDPWIVEDCALAAENLMLAAFDEGLGTC